MASNDRSDRGRRDFEAGRMRRPDEPSGSPGPLGPCEVEAAGEADRPGAPPTPANDDDHFLIRLEPQPRRHGPLPFAVRVGIFLLGWLLIVIGIAGLVLPGIQGVFTIVAGATLLSLDNELAYRLLRRCFERWPKIWLRVEAFRDKLHLKLHRFRRHR